MNKNREILGLILAGELTKEDILSAIKRPGSIIAHTVKHYPVGTQPGPGDPVKVDGGQVMTIQEFNQVKDRYEFSVLSIIYSNESTA